MDEFASWLNEEIERRGWNYADVARHGGISKSMISRVISGQSQPGLDFCVAVGRAFQVAPDQVLRRAGLLPSLPEPVAEEREVVAIMRELPAGVRRIVVTMLRALARPGASPPAPTLELPDDIFVPELLEEFEQVPEEWRQEAISQVRWIRQLAERPRFQVIGEEAEEIEAERDAAPEG